MCAKKREGAGKRVAVRCYWYKYDRERERERERMCFKPMLLVCTTYLLPRQVSSKLVLKPRSSWLEQEQKFFLVLFDLHRLSGSIRDDAAAVDVDAIPSLLSR